jgi:hypothetical protein
MPKAVKEKTFLGLSKPVQAELRETVSDFNQMLQDADVCCGVFYPLSYQSGEVSITNLQHSQTP